MEIRSILKDILEELWDGGPLSGDADLIEGGVLDSMSILFLISELETRLFVTIPLEDVVEENFRDMNSIERYLKQITG